MAYLVVSGLPGAHCPAGHFASVTPAMIALITALMIFHTSNAYAIATNEKILR